MDSGGRTMSQGRFKRLRQYKKVYQISHKKLIGCHVLTTHEKEVLKYLEVMAIHTAFRNAINMTLVDVITYFNFRGLNNE